MALPEISSAIDFRITTQPTRTYAIDFENKRIVGKTDELNAMVQAVRKALTTQRYYERIYSGDYGTELNKLIGKPLEYVKAMIRMILEETFSPDRRIKGIKRVEINQKDSDTINVYAHIITEYGEIYVEHAIMG